MVMTLFMVLHAFGSNPSSLSSHINKREYKKYNKILK